MTDLNFGINIGLVEELFAQYLENPESVDETWRAYFDEQAGRPKRSLASWPVTPTATAAQNGKNGGAPAAQAASEAVERAFAATLSMPPLSPIEPQPALFGSIPPTTEVLAEAAQKARVAQLLNAYRVRGHFFAHIDPLGSPTHEHAELDLANFGLSERDLDKTFPGLDLPGPQVRTLREIVEQLEETYCRSIGVEFSHIQDPEARLWLRGRMESTRNRMALSREHQLRILTKLTEAEVFEQFIHGSYGAGTKRFSLEGAESMIPLLDLVIDRAAETGVEEVVVGMAHRGRLNVLVNVMNKGLHEIFAAFEDTDALSNVGRGDVKYHLGYSTDRTTSSGKAIHLTLTFNPSHLEFVNPVVEGRVRAKQDRRAGQVGPFTRPDKATAQRVMPLLIHGDAAFIGQGIVPETLNLSRLEGYATGGTVHLIVNNQIGFTTDPSDSRSTKYASDITRMLQIPVFHVNGEDPEAVAQVATLAMDYRQRFAQDVVIDMYCYRKYGHNEGDEPRYTQPSMYRKIDQKPTVRRMYIDRLLGLGQINEETAEEIVQTLRHRLDEAFREVRANGFVPKTYSMGGVWSPYSGGLDGACPKVKTGVPRERLIALSEKLYTLPAHFNAHPKILPVLKQRHERLVDGAAFDWGAAEALAYATILDEGYPVRISGQDVRRGTFSHRHAVLHDAVTGEKYAPHAAVCRGRARFDVFNSPLSEQGVLGFEFGYSLDYPDALVIWEAQFGDFLNGAQVIVDQFITSCEDKWHRLSGLVLLLPHGYEGQGPEHSSARLERFLQNSAEDNIQVCNLSTPAQLFHALRRQVIRPWRKPLVICTPKSLLRVAATSKGPHRPVSTIDDLASETFQRVIPDVDVQGPSTRKVLLCSGKVYYDLALEREARGATDVAIVRLEQLYPIGDELVEALASYATGTPLVWVQEEPLNFGAWYFVNARVPRIIGDRLPLRHVGREPSASPATGSRASHLYEQKMLIDEALR